MMNHDYENLNESDEEVIIENLKQTIVLNAKTIEKSTSEMFTLLEMYFKREKELKHDLRACQRENEILKSRLQKQLVGKHLNFQILIYM